MNHKGVKLEEWVKDQLSRKPEIRDDDRRLIANFYWWVSGSADSPLTLREFLSKFVSDKLPMPDSILRTRRRLQEMYPELRGEKYEERAGYRQQVESNVRDGKERVY